MAAQHCRVCRRRIDCEPIEEIAHARKFEPASEQVQRRQGPIAAQLIGGEADAAIADHHRGYALARLVVHVGPVEQRVVIVGMHVDESGCHHPPGCIDLGPATDRRQAADRGDFAIADTNVGFAPRRALAIDDIAVSNDQVVAVFGHVILP